MTKKDRKTTLFFLRYSIFALLLVLNSAIFAQIKPVRIVNKKTGEPIPDVIFNYGNSSGISNSQGEIHIQFSEGNSLYLSHLQIGKREISATVVKVALEQGFLEIPVLSYNLLPVTFLPVHPDAGQKAVINVSVQEKLEHDAGQLLEQLSSVSVIRKSASYGFDPVLRGFKFDQLNLVVDGTQTASAACPNRMDPASSQIPVNMISEVEVTRGPYSLRYGNAFGGTINFKSSTPRFSETIHPVGRLGSSFESNGNVWRTEGVAGVTGKKTDVKLFGSYSTGNDYIDGEGVEIPAGFNRLNWGGKMGVKLGMHQNLGILVSNNRAKNVDFPALPMDLREDNTWLVNTSHAAYFYGKALSSWNSAVYFTQVNHSMDNYDKVIIPRTTDAFTDAKTTNYGGRTELRFDFNTGYLFSGLDYRLEAADGERTRNMLMGPMAGKSFHDNVWQDAQINRTGIFAEYHIQKPGFHAVASGRIDYNSAKSNNADPGFESLYAELSSTYINPSLSVGGTKMLNEEFSLGLWLGSAQRSPGIAERFINFFPIGLDPYEMVGNPQLKPETNNQFDIILEYNSKSTAISIDFFSSLLQNYISSEIVPDIKPKMATSPGVRRFVNINRAQITGFEAEWKQVLTRFLNHGFSVVYTYGQDKNLEEPLPEIAPLEIKYSLKGNFAKNKILPEILFRSVAKQDRIALSYGETNTPGFQVSDAKLTWLASQRITATGGVLNVFDTAYYEHLSRSVRAEITRPIYSPGRSFFVTLTYNFL